MRRTGIPGIPQRLPAPLDLSNPLVLSKLSSSLSSKIGSFSKSKSIFKPSSIPLNFFKTSSSKRNNNPNTKMKKCPKGTRKNRKTKVCETESVIGFRTRRKYTKGANKKCPKGTRRNKVTNNCEPK
jgi:hypothetical protein